MLNIGQAISSIMSPSQQQCFNYTFNYQISVLVTSTKGNEGNKVKKIGQDALRDLGKQATEIMPG